jgi:broad specificity phosphatase PhoE
MGSTMIRFAVALVLVLSPVALHAQLMVILVRHAELVGEPMSEPKDVPLSRAGQARAQRLADMFRNTGIAAIYVTDYLRTSQTAEPLARRMGRHPIVLPKGDPQALARRLRTQHAGQRVMVIGHNDTLPGLLSALGHPKEIRIQPYDYGNVFIVVPKGDGVAPAVLRLRTD